jgi:glucose-1-phosphate thymidylyltransferase
MWGIVPAAGVGSRIQPLAFSKELLPIGVRLDGEVERPRAISEYLVDRLILGGASKICFVIAPGKADIINYFGAVVRTASLCYAVQPTPRGLCDAVFRALPFIDPHDPVLIGLPDTIWFPEDGYCSLGGNELSFLLFPVDNPECFDAVVTDACGRVCEVRVKQAVTVTKWVWGAIKMPGTVLHELFDLWCKRDQRDEYLGTLVNEYLARGGTAVGVNLGASYVDVGTVHGYHEAIRLLEGQRLSLKETSGSSLLEKQQVDYFSGR